MTRAAKPTTDSAGPPRQRKASPTHPGGKAAVLLAAVTLLIIALAFASTFASR